MIDQDTNVPGVFVDFFSRPAWTPSGLAILAIKTGAPVVLALDVRLEGNRHKSIITGPIEVAKTGNMDKDVIETTSKITKQKPASRKRCPIANNRK